MSSEYEDDFINSYQATSRRSASKTYQDPQSQASYTHRTQQSSRFNRSEEDKSPEPSSSSSSSSLETSNNSINMENPSVKQYSNKQQQFSKRDEQSNTLNGLSSKELKNKLIQVVKNKGILDHMKSQLRNKLALELNTNIEQIKNKNADLSSKQRSNLALTTINCLIIDHLKTNEYDYSLSVFMPECGITMNEVYSLADILHVIKVSPESKLYTDLNDSNVVRKKGLLWHLVSHLCTRYVTHEMSTQTDYDGVHNVAASLDFKLKNVEKYYASRADNIDSKLTFEEKIVAYQKQIEEKTKQEYQEKIRQFKEFEVAQIRNEEREKLRLETQTFRAELEHSYGKRHEALRQREQALEDLSKQRREVEERELFLQRQKLLDEMKLLREQEAEFKKSVEWRARISNVDLSKLERLDEELKKRETALKLSEEELEVRLRNEREKIKLELERTFSQRQFVLDSVEARNRQEATQNDVDRAHLDRLRHEFQSQQARLAELQLEAQKAKGESLCLRQENALIKEKLSRCLDYDFVLNENKALIHKLEISKEIIGEKSLKSRHSSMAEPARNLLIAKEPKFGINQVDVSSNEKIRKNGEKVEIGQSQEAAKNNALPAKFSLSEHLEKIRERNAEGQLTPRKAGRETKPLGNLIPGSNVKKSEEVKKKVDSRWALPSLPGGYVPQRKRSVTFASEANEGEEVNEDESSEMEATEMAAEALPRDPADNSELDEKSRVSLRDEGERVLNEALERDEMRDALLRNGLVSAEMRDLYEMQVFEQRKLHDTVNDVKKQVEFLYNGIIVSDEEPKMSRKAKIEAPSLEFIESARERLRYLESEGERVEQNYRDYQHKIKSKYYPINDDEEGEVKLVARKNRRDDVFEVERFLEATLRASVGAKVMREELEAEWAGYKKKEEAKVFNEEKLKVVEEIIKSAPLIPVIVQQNSETDEIRRRIFKEQEELKRFQNSHIESKSVPMRKVVLEESSATETAKKEDLDEERTMASENSEKRVASPSKGGFTTNDYFKMLSIKEKREEASSDEEIKKPPPPGKSRITIEYSTSSSSDSSQSNEPRKLLPAATNNNYREIDKKSDEDEDDW